MTKETKMLGYIQNIQGFGILKFFRTRYAYMFLILESCLQVYPTLEKMVVCDAWQDYRTFELREFKNPVLINSFWSAENIVKYLQPFYIVFRSTDT
jgi:hypothetical protein